MHSKDSATQSDDGEATRIVQKGHTSVPAQVVVTSEDADEEAPTIPLSSLQELSALRPEVSVHPLTVSRSMEQLAPLVVQPTEYRWGITGWLQLWWDGMRPHYLSLALLPVLLGSALAWVQSISAKSPFGHFHLLHFIATGVGIALLQMGANLVNDYYDYIKGVDTSNVLGPGGLIRQNFIKPRTVLSVGLLCLFLGAALGLVIAVAGGFYLYVLGAIGLLCALLYSATAYSLASLALGELISFLIFGPLLTVGAYIVQAGLPTHPVLTTLLIYSLPLGLLATAVVHANNMRDAESDLQANKRTLANLLGARLSRILFLLLVVGAYAQVLVLGLPHHAPHLLLLTLWTLPSLLVIFTGILRADVPATFHLIMRETLKLEIYFTLLLLLALILNALIPALPHISLPFHLLSA